MTAHSNQLPPADICLLLRTHAEQHWLGREVAPLLRELQDRDPLGDEQLAVARAYLEVAWIEACMRAVETDAARARLDGSPATDGALQRKARAYHAAVRTLRERLADRVAALIAEADLDFTGEPLADALSQEEARHEADRIRSGRWRSGLTSRRIRRTPMAR